MSEGNSRLANLKEEYAANTRMFNHLYDASGQREPMTEPVESLWNKSIELAGEIAAEEQGGRS